MHYELQTLVFCPTSADDCPTALLEGARELEAKLKAAGVGFVMEVRDIRRGTRLSRAVGAGDLGGSGL
ncbi:hypothetical protein [Azospirillum sp.]|uniref:hypothetical protein n=1 Tax=Azospirillum sp. TaxID=34012 RepID=UPI002D2DE7FD|nr:hypothetical protein [Azospirillum sp.]HYD65739.1 hypothetical protein [Azospirillum sp.]